MQYAIFTKLIAVDDKEIFYVKGKEFLSTINMYFSIFHERRGG